MWFLLWLAWCWFVTPSRSVDARCGQLRFRYHVLPSSAGVPTPLAALLADFGDAGFRFPCDAFWWFRSHALLVSVGRRSSPAFYCPCGYVLVARSTPLPRLAPGLGMVRFLGRFGLAPLRLAQLPLWFDSWLEDAGLLAHSPVVHPNMPGLVRGVRLCVPPLLGLSVYGGFRTQGCAAKACRPCSVPRSLVTPAPKGALPRPPVLSVSVLPRDPELALCALSLVVPTTWGTLPRPTVLSMAPTLPRPLVLACARPLPWLVTSGPSVASVCRSLVFKL
ncbi:hypothetical protein V6N13_040301 [Hibiscus sabdariffa]